jgi:hypothetical protein
MQLPAKTVIPIKGQTPPETTNRVSFPAAVILMPFAAVVAMMRAAYDKHVPIGYEDETGFHLGPEPRSSPAPRTIPFATNSQHTRR